MRSSVSPPASDRISVILPTLNEAGRIGRRIAELRGLDAVHEIIVCDGGSTDATVALVGESRTSAASGSAAAPLIRVVEAPRGRASQMNAGAREATGEVLLFLHADCALPADAAVWIQRTLANPAVVAGAFRIRTVNDGEPNRWSALLFLADLRARYSGLPYGDQAIFVRRDVFERLGGYAPVALMEDLELSRRLRKAGRVVVVPAAVRVSGRRFLARPVAYTLAVNVFPLLYRLGVPPRVLGRFYGNPR